MLNIIPSKKLPVSFKLNPRTILDRIRSGELKAFKVGKDWRVSKTALEEWIHQRSEENSKTSDET